MFFVDNRQNFIAYFAGFEILVFINVIIHFCEFDAHNCLIISAFIFKLIVFFEIFFSVDATSKIVEFIVVIRFQIIVFKVKLHEFLIAIVNFFLVVNVSVLRDIVADCIVVKRRLQVDVESFFFVFKKHDVVFH